MTEVESGNIAMETKIVIEYTFECNILFCTYINGCYYIHLARNNLVVI